MKTIKLATKSISNFALINSLLREKNQSYSKITFNYGNEHKVDRVWNKGDKRPSYYPSHKIDNKWVTGKGKDRLGDRSKWPPYGAENLTEENCFNKYPLFCEGEKDVEFAKNKGIIAITTVGADATGKEVLATVFKVAQKAFAKGFIYLYDNDKSGLEKAQALVNANPSSKFEVLAYNIKEIYPESTQGSDLTDYFNANPKITAEKFEEKINQLIQTKQPLQKTQIKENKETTMNSPYESFLSDLKLPVDQVIPLEECLSTDSKIALNGIDEGNRGNVAQSLFTELKGTEDYLKSILQPYSGTAEELMERFCQRSGYEDRDSKGIKKWSLDKNATPTLTPDYIKGCIAGYIYREDNSVLDKYVKKSSNKARSKNLESKDTEFKGDELIKAIDDLLQKTLSNSQLKKELIDLSKKFSVPATEVKELYKEKTIELNQRESKEGLSKDLASLIKLQERASKVNLKDYYLPEYLIERLNERKKIIGTSDLAILTSLWPCMGSLVNPKIFLRLIPNSKFDTRLNNIYSALVGESGCSKSPTMDFFVDPLHVLQRESREIYELEKIEYEQELAAWEDAKQDAKKNKKGFDLPEPTQPKRRFFFLEDATTESLIEKQNNQPNKGMLLEFDELSSLLDSANKYRKGGNDTQIMLSARSGKLTTVHRKNTDSLECDRANWSILGGITKSTLKKQMGDGSDGDGHWARFIFAMLPSVAKDFDNWDIEVDDSDLILNWYRKIESWFPDNESGRLSLSTKAKPHVRKILEQLDASGRNEDNPALRSVLSKYPRVIGELAEALHIIKQINNGTNESLIDEETIIKAIELTKIYIGQVKLIHADANFNKELAPNLKAILDMSINKKDGLTSRQVSRGPRIFRDIPVSEIRKLFLELVSLGYGEVKGEGSAMTYFFNKGNKVTQEIKDEIKEDKATQETIKEEIKQVEVVVESQEDTQETEYKMTVDEEVKLILDLQDKPAPKDEFLQTVLSTTSFVTFIENEWSEDFIDFKEKCTQEGLEYLKSILLGIKLDEESKFQIRKMNREYKRI